MSAKIMFTELRRVCSNGYMHYIPEFEEIFPELKNVSNEEMVDRFRKLGIEFYTTEEKPVSLLVRLSMPFAFITFIIMLMTSPIHFFITGRWKYRLKSNGKLMNWFDAVGF